MSPAPYALGALFAGVGAAAGMHTSESVYVFDDAGGARKRDGVAFGWAPLGALWGGARGDAAFMRTVFLQCNDAQRAANADVRALTFERKSGGAPLPALLGHASWRAAESRYVVPRDAFPLFTTHKTSDDDKAALIERFKRA